MTEEDGTPADEEDPFDRLAADVGEREGDPFENLEREETADQSESGTAESNEGAGSVSETQDGGAWVDDLGSGSGSTARAGSTADDSMVGEPGETRTAETATTADSGSGEPEDAERSLDIGQQARQDPLGDVGDREGDPFEESGSLFEERDTESVDPDEVWRDLASVDSHDSAEDAYERTFADVSKHSYCEQCEHFSPPPDVACTNEGTDIVEFLDMETVRVVDCPVVAERRELRGDE